MAEEREWVCTACDWIGSPKEKPDECPNCGAVDTLDEVDHG